MPQKYATQLDPIRTQLKPYDLVQAMHVAIVYSIPSAVGAGGAGADFVNMRLFQQFATFRCTLENLVVPLWFVPGKQGIPSFASSVAGATQHVVFFAVGMD